MAVGFFNTACALCSTTSCCADACCCYSAKIRFKSRVECGSCADNRATSSLSLGRCDGARPFLPASVQRACLACVPFRTRLCVRAFACERVRVTGGNYSRVLVFDRIGRSWTSALGEAAQPAEVLRGLVSEVGSRKHLINCSAQLLRAFRVVIHFLDVRAYDAGGTGQRPVVPSKAAERQRRGSFSTCGRRGYEPCSFRPSLSEPRAAVVICLAMMRCVPDDRRTRVPATSDMSASSCELALLLGEFFSLRSTFGTLFLHRLRSLA